MNANQINAKTVVTMDLAAANSALKVSGITALQRQMVQTRITKLSTPAPEVIPPAPAAQEGTPAEGAQEGAGTPAEGTPAEGTDAPADKPADAPVVAPVLVNIPKNKPGETTRDIEKFVDDTKGIRKGTRVTFLENNKPGAKTIHGTVQRLFDFWAKPTRQEAKIKGDNGARIYRFEKDLTVEVPVVVEPVETPTPEVAEGSGI